MKLTIALLLALTAPASAFAASIYNSAAAWNAKMKSTTSVALPDTGGGVNSFSAGDLTFTKSGSATNLITASSDNYWSTLIPGIDLAISSPEDVTITFAAPVTGFAFLLHEPTLASGSNNPPDPDSCNTASCADTLFNFKLLAGGIEIGSFDLLPADDTAVFVGFASGTAFDTVVIDDVTNDIDNEFFGAFQVGAIVPLPATLPLMLGGLAGLGLLARRQSSKRT